MQADLLRGNDLRLVFPQVKLLFERDVCLKLVAFLALVAQIESDPSVETVGHPGGSVSSKFLIVEKIWNVKDRLPCLFH